MQIDDLILVSVDDHVVEPPNLFDGRLSNAAAERAPRLERLANGREVWMFEGAALPNVGLNAVVGRVPEEYGLDALAFDQMRPGCFDIHERIRDMDVNGVLGSLNFPSMTGFTGQLFMTMEEKDIALELLRAYNDWHVEDWCGTYPGRMIPLAVPPVWDPQLMADEVRRMAERGCHAVTFSENPEKLRLPSWHSDHWDPFLSACEETGTVICLHIGSSSSTVITAMDAPIDTMITLQPMNIVQCAAENGVDLATVKGTGVGGRIRKQDVLAAAGPKEEATSTAAPAAAKPAAAPAAPSPLAHLRGTTAKANRIRQITARKTRESLQATAQLTQTHEVDMTKIVALRARAKKEFAEREGVNLTYLPFIARAAIDALKAHPNVNASYNEDTGEITYYDAEHLGFAVDTEQGLLSPVVHNAGDLSLAGLARAINDIASRARSGGLKPDELSGGTFTITNIGSQGALFDTPILVPPQAAMLGTGAIVKRPRVIIDESGNESIGVRSVCYLPLTYDHRLIDGADAGRFVTTIRKRLEEAAFEAELGL